LYDLIVVSFLRLNWRMGEGQHSRLCQCTRQTVKPKTGHTRHKQLLPVLFDSRGTVFFFTGKTSAHVFNVVFSPLTSVKLITSEEHEQSGQVETVSEECLLTTNKLCNFAAYTYIHVSRTYTVRDHSSDIIDSAHELAV
jgi:hypothetical protein